MKPAARVRAPLCGGFAAYGLTRMLTLLCNKETRLILSLHFKSGWVFCEEPTSRCMYTSDIYVKAGHPRTIRFAQVRGRPVVSKHRW